MQLRPEVICIMKPKKYLKELAIRIFSYIIAVALFVTVQQWRNAVEIVIEDQTKNML